MKRLGWVMVVVLMLVMATTGYYIGQLNWQRQIRFALIHTGEEILGPFPIFNLSGGYNNHVNVRELQKVCDPILRVAGLRAVGYGYPKDFADAQRLFDRYKEYGVTKPGYCFQVPAGYRR